MPINPLRGIRVPAAEHTPPYESFLESRGFRPEIQGLRAFAVLLVVLYHVWIGKVSGGVDVFSLHLGFLAFALVHAENQRGQTAEPADLLDSCVRAPVACCIRGDCADSCGFLSYIASVVLECARC